MRKLMIVLVIAAVAVPMQAWAISGVGDPIPDNSWSQQWRTDFFGQDYNADGYSAPVNIVNLRLRPASGSQEFQAIWPKSSYSDSWEGSVSSDGLYAVLAPTSPTNSVDRVNFYTKWPGEAGADEFYMDWSECYYDENGNVAALECGTVHRNNGRWTVLSSAPADWCDAAKYDSAYEAKTTPEPATWALLLATVGFGGIARRRKRS